MELSMFARRLKEQRLSWGMTQKEIAEEVGINVSTIGKYEQGVCKPAMVVFLRLCLCLGVSADYLLGDLEAFLQENLQTQAGRSNWNQ